MVKIRARLFSNAPLLGLLAVTWLVVAISTGWWLIYDSDGPEDTTWQRLQENKVLVVGVDPGFPPFAQLTPDQQLSGIDVDLAYALAEELGFAVEIKLVGFDSRFDQLYLGQVDILIAAMRPDLRRLDRVRYTESYFDGGHVFVAANDFAGSMPRHLEELEGLTLAVEFAAPGDVAARKAIEEDGLDIALLRLLSPTAALEAVVNGKAEVALVDRVSARLFANTHPELRLSQAPLISDPYVIATRREDWRLRLHINQAIETLRDDGSLNEILNRWL